MGDFGLRKVMNGLRNGGMVSISMAALVVEPFEQQDTTPGTRT
jgi:hypothetical protein